MQQCTRVVWLGAAIGALFSAVAILQGCTGTSAGSASVPVVGAPSGNDPPPIPVPRAVLQAQETGAAVDPAIVAADNAFGLSLLNILIPVNPGNVTVAPISVALALQIVFNGAGGSTQQAMAQTLQLGTLGTQDLNGANAALQASLINPDPNVQITLGNSLWMHLTDNPVSPSFVQTDETYYGATVGDLSGAPDNVNAWVASESRGLITQILPPQPPSYYQAVTAIVADVIYFKGQWSTQFDTSQTTSAGFTSSDGTEVSVEMMHQTGSYGYLQGVNFQAVRLPYGQGRLSMLLVLPNPGTDLDSLVAGITAEGLNGWIAQLKTLGGDIALPRFTTTFAASLPNALSALGMGIAFCPNAADFSGIAPLRCLADIEHKVVVQVDENGTVATGATAVPIGVTAVPSVQFTMTLDRPFFYAIRDDQSGALLFVGTVQNPSAVTTS